MKNNNYNLKDFANDQEIKWCPGCGDYSILKQVQSILPNIGISKEKIVFISGIGCSSRFPYYMNTYGMHSIHGRATAVATGLKSSRPDLNVWVITGDGDSLSIGGNHLIHLLRRNLDLNILLFNNEIYGLTKGQYSPTSELGKTTKSTPLGSIDNPFNPISLSLGADASFIARAIDREPKHMRQILIEANNHRGTSLIEIYQNCNIFNDGAFSKFTNKDFKKNNSIYLENNKPLIFGDENDKGIKLDGIDPLIVDLNDKNISVEDLWIHDQKSIEKANILSRFSDINYNYSKFPRPFGIFFQKKRKCYEDEMLNQINFNFTEDDLNKLIAGDLSWNIK